MQVVDWLLPPAKSFAGIRRTKDSQLLYYLFDVRSWYSLQLCQLTIEPFNQIGFTRGHSFHCTGNHRLYGGVATGPTNSFRDAPGKRSSWYSRSDRRTNRVVLDTPPPSGDAVIALGLAARPGLTYRRVRRVAQRRNSTTDRRHPVLGDPPRTLR